MKDKPITVLLADDHPLFREGMRGLLTRDGRFEVVAEAATGDQAEAALLKLKPMVALLDHSMPRRNGLEVVRAVRAAGLPTRCALLSSFGQPLLVAEALRAGADGYLLKEDSPTVLADGVARLAAGECALSPSLDRAGLRAKWQARWKK